MHFLLFTVYCRLSTVFLNWFDIHFVMSFVTFWGETTKKVRSPRALPMLNREFSFHLVRSKHLPLLPHLLRITTRSSKYLRTHASSVTPSPPSAPIGISFVYPIRLVPLPVIICYLFAFICTAFSLEFHYIDDKKLDKPRCHVVWLYSLLDRPSTFLTQFWLLTLETLKTN